MINFKQVLSMLELQNTMNSIVNPNWVNLNWDYMRASCLEGSEAIDHHGWKWWKYQNKDLPQLQMEIIDIWHFYLSRYLQISQGDELIALELIQTDFTTQESQDVIFDGKNYVLENLSLLDKLDLFIGLAAAKRMNLRLFFSLVIDCELSWKDLFEQYTKKNVLNIFRQKNGYKEGTYHKEWFGKEDNVFLLLEADKLDSTSDDYTKLLWTALEKTYHEALLDKITTTQTVFIEKP